MIIYIPQYILSFLSIVKLQKIYNSPIVIYDSAKKKLIKMTRTPMLNIDKQQSNHPICKNIDEKENDKEDNLTSEEDRTQQDGEE